MNTTFRRSVSIFIGLATLAATQASGWAGEFQPGKWTSISIQGGHTIAGSNFKINGKGSFRGRTLYYTGDISKIAGEVDAEGNIRIRETFYGGGERETGGELRSISDRGRAFAAKLDGKVTLYGQKVPGNFKAAGAYYGATSFGDLFGALIEADGNTTVFVYIEGEFVRLEGRTIRKRVTVQGSGIVATGRIVGKRVIGTAILNGVEIPFRARYL